MVQYRVSPKCAHTVTAGGSVVKMRSTLIDPASTVTQSVCVHFGGHPEFLSSRPSRCSVRGCPCAWTPVCVGQRLSDMGRPSWAPTCSQGRAGVSRRILSAGSPAALHVPPGMRVQARPWGSQQGRPGLRFLLALAAWRDSLTRADEGGGAEVAASHPRAAPPRRGVPLCRGQCGSH